MIRMIPVRETILGGAILVLLLLIASRFSGFVAPSNLANVFNDTAIDHSGAGADGRDPYPLY